MVYGEFYSSTNIDYTYNEMYTQALQNSTPCKINNSRVWHE